MDMQFSPIAVLMFIAVFVSLFNMLFIHRRRDQNGALPLMWLIGAIAVWTFFRGFEALFVDNALKIWMAKLEYLGIAAVPVLWFVFAFQYAGFQKETTTKRYLWLGVVPLITFLLVLSNEAHGLIWRAILPNPGSIQSILVYDHGTWFWIQMIYGYLLLLLGTLRLAQTAFSRLRLYRQQSTSILIGVFIPWIGNAVYLMGGSPVPGLDLTPLAFTITGLILSWSLYRYRLFDIAPIARDKLVESMPDGMIVLDHKQRVVDINPAACRIVSLSADRMLGEILPPVLPSIPYLQTMIDETPTAKRSIVLKSGSVTRHVEISLSAIEDNHRQLKGRLILLRDITDRLKAQTDLQEHEKRLKAILSASPIGLGLVVDRVLDWANTAMYDMLGYPRDALRGQNARVLYADDEEYERVGTILYRSIQQTGKGQIETRWLKKSGRLVDCLIRGCALDPADPSKGLIVAVVDISEEKQVKARLKRAEQMEIVGSMAGGVAHDLNNILSAIVGYPDLLLMQLPSDSPLKKHVQTIKDSGNKAAAIVQDLLTLSRRGVSVKAPVQLNRIVSEYLDSPECRKLKSFHPAVDIQTHLDEDLAGISGSPVHLGKTVMNLVSNAAEAMEAGGTIDIRTFNRTIDAPIEGYDTVAMGDYVVLQVSDTGIGISAADQERIFEPFFTKKVMGRSGTGLGMAVVWGTVKDHEGYIDIESKEGNGTTFSLYFPSARMQPIEKSSSFKLERYKGHGQSILVVDDMDDQRQIATNILTTLGYRVTTAEDGQAAVEWIAKRPFDLVLLDMIMDPDMDGLDTYRQMAAVRPQQKIVIVSGFSETDRVKEALHLGAASYVRKPYTIKKIAAAVKAALA